MSFAAPLHERPVSPWSLSGQVAHVRFTVLADPSPGLLPRLLAPFARRDLVPDAVDARMIRGQMQVEIHLPAMPAEMVHLVAGNLEAAIGVCRVALRQEITGQVQRRAA